jgi:hypothetical protein
MPFSSLPRCACDKFERELKLLFNKAREKVKTDI